MTRHVLRIIVTIIILSLVGYVVWYIFFKPNNNQVVYALLQETVELDEKENSLSSNLLTLQERPFYSIGASKQNFSEVNPAQQEIMNMRSLIFGISDTALIEIFYGEMLEDENFTASDLILLKDNFLNINRLNGTLNELLNYYYSYFDELGTLTSKEVETVKDLVNKFKSEYEGINTTVKQLINYQLQGSNTSTVNQETTNYYKVLLGKYKNYYNAFVNLNLGLKTLFSESLYENFIYNFKLIENEANLYSIKNYVDSMNYESDDFVTLNDFDETVVQINKKLYDASVIAFTLNKHGQQFLKDEVINAIITYNDLYQNYSEILFSSDSAELPKSIYFKTNQVKHNILNNIGVDEIIMQGYVEKVQTILVFLGF